MIDDILNKIDSLLSIGKSIDRLYVAIDTDREGIIQTILQLISKEQEILKSIDLKKPSVRSVLNKILASFSKDNALPFGVLYDLQENEYPYYRLLAHLNYFDNDPRNTDFVSIRTLIDTEIAFLFNELCAKAMRGKAFRILMNAPDVEVKALNNGLKPFDAVYESLDWEVQFKSLKQLVDLKRMDVEVDKSGFSIPSANELRISFYVEKLMAISQSISDAIAANKAPMDLISVRSYLNSILALIDEDDLEDMKFNAMDVVANPEVQELVCDSFEEAPKLMELKVKISLLSTKE